MRVYATFKEAKNEIARDLNELGRDVLAGYQSKDMSQLTSKELVKLRTKELTDYDYIVLKPEEDDLNPIQPWADAEWAERLSGINGKPVNPGTAWGFRQDLWEPLIEHQRGNGDLWEEDSDEDWTPGFSYTYSERLADCEIPSMVQAMKANPFSRQVWVSIWNPELDSTRLGKRRVPCTLGYQLTVRDNRLNIAYHMRSSDFTTHFDNDIWMAMRLQLYFAVALNIRPGTFTHKIGSLHVYAADVAGVF